MSTKNSIVRRTWIMLILPPVMLLLVSILFGVIFFFYTQGDGSLIPGYFQSYMPLILVLNHLILFLILWSFLKKDGLQLKDIGWFIDKKKLPTDILVALVFVIVLYLYNNLVIEPIQAYYNGNPVDFSLTLSLRDQIDWIYLAMAVTIPVVEELIYRGYAYRGFKRKYGIAFTIIVSSILFGSLHWGMGALTAALVIPFGLLYFLVLVKRKGNLVAITLSHCLYNGAVLMLI